MAFKRLEFAILENTFIYLIRLVVFEIFWIKVVLSYYLWKEYEYFNQNILFLNACSLPLSEVHAS